LRARLENISPKMQGRTIFGLSINQTRFDSLWHYHPEYELTYIIKGNGRRMVGDDMENFNEGDLVLLGPDLPHTWIGERSSTTENNIALVIQFSEEFLAPFLSLIEMKSMNELLTKSERGIRFLKFQPIAIEKRMLQIIEDTTIKRVTGLIELLYDLSNKKYKILASHKFNIIKNEKSYATVWLDDDDGLSPNFLMNVNKYENETGKIVSFPIGIDYTVINNTLLYGKNRDFKNIALGITAIGFNIFMVPGCHTKFNTIREVIYDYTPESYYVCCSEFCNTKRKFHQKEGVPTNIS